MHVPDRAGWPPLIASAATGAPKGPRRADAAGGNEILRCGIRMQTLLRGKLNCGAP